MLHPKLNSTRSLITSLSRAYHPAQPHPLQLIQQFQSSESDPDEFAISKSLSITAHLNSLHQGTQIHAFLLKKNTPFDVVATNSLINLYLKCGCVEDAERIFCGVRDRDVYTWTVMVSGYALNGRMKQAMVLFEEMPRRNTVSWNSVINGYQIKGHNESALELFNRMRREGEHPNKITYVSALKACVGLHNLYGVHCLLVKSSWIDDVMVECTLVDMYARNGNMLASCKSFEEIKVHSVVSWSILLSGFAMNGNVKDVEGIFGEMPEKNVVSWNTMITSYVQNGMQEKAFGLFVDMMREGMKPNCFTMTSLLSGCSNSKLTEKGKLFHGYVIKIGLDSDTTISNSLITMYGEHKITKDARLVFDSVHFHDLISWTAMVSAYINSPDINEARYIFDMMPEKNLISWNTMMFGYLQYEKDTALMFFYEMERSKIKPDHFSYNCALTACANNEALEQARSIHCRVIKRGFESEIGVGNSLITVYGKCGSLGEAEKCFKEMDYHDMISWNSLLTCYSQNGQGNEVLKFYEDMKNSGVKPNRVTFISLLSACSYLGEVKKGEEIFDEMEKEHNIRPSKEHYTCMVDLLGRAGLLYEAEALIKKMPVEPDATLWGALLGACKIHKDPVLGRRAADQIFWLEPNNSAAHIALAETFASAEMWDNVARTRALIKEKRLLKEPGCSWIQVRNKKHVFLSGDHCYLENDHIYEVLSMLYSNLMEKAGHNQLLQLQPK